VQYPVSSLTPVKEDRKPVYESLVRPALKRAGAAEILECEASKGGPAKAWNELAKRATQPYIYFGDDDSVVSSDMFRAMFDSLKGEEIVSVSHGVFDAPGTGGGSTLQLMCPDLRSGNGWPAWTKEALLQGNFIGFYMVKREKFLGFDESFERFADWDYMIRSCEAGHNLLACNGVFVISLNVSFADHYDTITVPDTLDKWANQIRSKHGSFLYG
jgi:hypothetical protein